MRRFWLRWALLILFVAVLGVVFVNMGEWQLDRLAQRKERNATTIANEQSPVRPYEQVFTTRSPTLINGSESRPGAPSMQTSSSSCAIGATGI